MTGEVEAYPLAWPIGWPRAKGRVRAKFGAVMGPTEQRSWSTRRDLTIAEGRDRLLEELDRLRAGQVVISSNAPLRLDGALRADVRNPSDPGAAVYFRLKGEPRVLAVDRWDRLADNLAALAAHIAALRAIDRYGVGSMAQAFAGYRALAAIGERPAWYQVLGFKAPPTPAQAEVKWRELMQKHHPDRGGNANQAAEVNAAYQEGLRAMGL